MLLIRDIMYCKPGKVRAMVEKFVAMAKWSEANGLGKMRVMTDFCAERYWTVVTQTEVPNMEAFQQMIQGKGMSPEVGKRFDEIMKGYHELVDHGRREIYTVEG